MQETGGVSRPRKKRGPARSIGKLPDRHPPTVQCSKSGYRPPSRRPLTSLWAEINTKPAMKMAMIREELMRPRLNPPCSNGLVSRSPNVAPSGRVRINASQNSQVREIFVRK